MDPQDNEQDRQPANERSPQQGERQDGGSSGEGAGSALEALVRKRQLRVDPQADLPGPPTPEQADGKAAGE